MIKIGALPCRGLLIPPGGAAVRFAIGREPITIGRDPGNTVRVPDASVGRRHCALTPGLHGEGTVIEDVGSPGGTYLGYQRVTSAEVHSGDVVQLGGTQLRFEHQWIDREPVNPTLAALRAAVCAEPANEAPRLVLADWLSDRADPQGELIQFQVELARHPEGSARRAELETLAAVLLARHEPAWVQPLPIFVEDWRFRGGCVEAVRVDPRAILEDDFAALRRAHPIRAVAIVPRLATPALLDRLAACAQLDGIAQVELPRNLEHAGLAKRFGRGAEDGVYGPETAFFTRFEMT